MNFGKKIAALLLCASLSTDSVNALVGPGMVPGPEVFAGVAVLSGATCLTAGYLLGGGDKELVADIAVKGLALYVVGTLALVGINKLAQKIRDYYDPQPSLEEIIQAQSTHEYKPKELIIHNS